jgi:hypothetical protein
LEVLQKYIQHFATLATVFLQVLDRQIIMNIAGLNMQHFATDLSVRKISCETVVTYCMLGC